MQGDMPRRARRRHEKGAESVRGRGSVAARFSGRRLERRLNRGPANVVVTMKQPEVEHTGPNQRNWLESADRTPAAMALKSRLRDIIGS